MDLSPTTLRTYRAQVEQIIRPRLGKIVLTRLTPKHLDDLYRHMKEEGRSPKTIRNYHAIISSALHQGVRWEWVRENVAEKAKPPRVAQRRVKAPSVEAVRSVIEAAEDRDPRLAPLLMLAALTGMRRGELCALRWTDVDLERGELDVSQICRGRAGRDRREGHEDRPCPDRGPRRCGRGPAGSSSGESRRVGAHRQRSRFLMTPTSSPTPSTGRSRSGPTTSPGFLPGCGTRSDCMTSGSTTCGTSQRPS